MAIGEVRALTFADGVVVSSPAVVAPLGHSVDDAVGWDGVAVSVAYDVSASVADARKMLWALYSVAGTYVDYGGEITLAIGTVTVTFLEPPAAGTYRLVGV